MPLLVDFQGHSVPLRYLNPLLYFYPNDDGGPTFPAVWRRLDARPGRAREAALPAGNAPGHPPCLSMNSSISFISRLLTLPRLIDRSDSSNVTLHEFTQPTFQAYISGRAAFGLLATFRSFSGNLVFSFRLLDDNRNL